MAHQKRVSPPSPRLAGRAAMQAVGSATTRGTSPSNPAMAEATRDILRRDKLRQIRAAVERAETGGSEAASRAKAKRLAPRPNMGQPARPHGIIDVTAIRDVVDRRARRRAERRATRPGAPRRR